MCSRCSGGGATPWWRHTTIGTSQISHSAIQHTSSSWNHGVMRAASQRSQSSTLPSSCSGADSGTDGHLLRGVDEAAHLAALPCDHHVLLVAHVRDLADALALRVVDPDLRA